MASTERAQELVAEPPEDGVIEPESSDIGDTFALIVTNSGTLVAASPGLDTFSILDAIPVAGADWGPRLRVPGTHR